MTFTFPKLYTIFIEVIKIDLNILDSRNNIFNKTKDILNSISTIIQNNIKNSNSFVIDRFEGKFAICENLKTKEIINIPISKLSSNIKEKDVITFKDNNFYLDKEKTEIRKEKIENLTKDIFENN